MSRRSIFIIGAVFVVVYVAIQFLSRKYDEYTMYGSRKFNLKLLDLDKKFKDYPANYPPDPGKAGEATLLGIDADNDGVRDDIQRWIYARFHKSPLQMKAMRKEFLSLQGYLEEKWVDLKDCYAHDKKFRSAEACWRAVFPESSTEIELLDSYEESKMLEIKVMNTYDRIRFYLKNGRACSGGAFGGADARIEACDE